MAWIFDKNLTELIQWVRTLGVASIPVFCVLYCVASLLFLPIVPIILAGGAIYGLYLGIVINLVSATLSALLAFMLSRYIGIEWLPKRIQQQIHTWSQKIDAYGWKSLAFFRLLPFIPCAIVNYGFGFTAIKTRSFMLISFIFFIPYKIIETYFGYTLHG